ncbi:MAG: hypothetical protein J1F69_04085 [Clostridiales bacterium]|nr:hypothetical protein [Clostridiales bacterium]
MYGIYGDIITAAEKATEAFSETEELLEYPEVQADKAYYLSVLSKYNKLKLINDKLNALKELLNSERGISELLTETKSDEEREIIYEEIASLKRGASKLSTEIANEIGCKHIKERVYCRFKFTAASSKFGVPFFSLIKEYLLFRGAKIYDEKTEYVSKGVLREASFVAEGEDIITRLSPLTGAHKVYLSGGKSEELCFAVTLAAETEKISEDDLKIDVFRSSGAGGQHINKTDSAVRITHIPTGLVVTCQDERSQLANKKRALEQMEKRLLGNKERSEKKRMEADIYVQYRKKNTPISFDYSNSTMTDTRLKAFMNIAFPFSDFSSYIDGLMVL